MREADCIIYGMFNVKTTKKGEKKTQTNSPLLPRCCKFSETPSASVQPNRNGITYRTQAYDFFFFFCHCKERNPKLWSTQKHTVMDCFELTLLWFYHLFLFYFFMKMPQKYTTTHTHKGKKTSMLGRKSASRIQFHIVCIILYDLVMVLLSLYCVKIYTVWYAWALK